MRDGRQDDCARGTNDQSHDALSVFAQLKASAIGLDAR
jgi:hypothetical protein